jgi:hypothetical protein
MTFLYRVRIDPCDGADVKRGVELRAVGEAMGTSEDAARMRISRALEKLHTLLKHRGVSLIGLVLS